MGHPVTWVEIIGDDPAKLRGFYGELLGWKFERQEFGGKEYSLIDKQDAGIGGGIGKAEQPGKGWLTFYVSVPDLKAAIAHAERLGGKLVRPIVELPELSFAVVADPEGHRLGLLKKQ